MFLMITLTSLASPNHTQRRHVFADSFFGRSQQSRRKKNMFTRLFMITYWLIKLKAWQCHIWQLKHSKNGFLYIFLSWRMKKKTYNTARRWYGVSQKKSSNLFGGSNGLIVSPSLHFLLDVPLPSVMHISMIRSWRDLVLAALLLLDQADRASCLDINRSLFSSHPVFPWN